MKKSEFLKSISDRFHDSDGSLYTYDHSKNLEENESAFLNAYLIHLVDCYISLVTDDYNELEKILTHSAINVAQEVIEAYARCEED